MFFFKGEIPAYPAGIERKYPVFFMLLFDILDSIDIFEL